MCPNLHFPWKIGQNFSNSHPLTLLFGSSHWMTPFLRKKSLTERPLVSRCCSSIPSLSKLSPPHTKIEKQCTGSQARQISFFFQPWLPTRGCVSWCVIIYCRRFSWCRYFMSPLIFLLLMMLLLLLIMYHLIQCSISLSFLSFIWSRY